jgi:Fe-S cluster assembly protein SufD
LSQDGAITLDDAIARVELPGRKDEAWKYTRPAQLLDQSFAPADPSPAEPADLEAFDPNARIVWVDGALDRAASRWPAELRVEELPADAMPPSTGFDALNQLYVRGAVRLVFAGSVPPVSLVHVSTGGGRLSAVRREIVVEAGARADVREHYVRRGEGAGLVTAVTEARVGAGAALSLVRVLDERGDTRHFGAVRANVAEGGRLDAVVASVAVKVARVEIGVTLDASAEATLSGLSLVRGAHVDHHVTVDHASPRSRSRQRFRALLDGAARSVFTGRVIVRPGADGTDAAQVHRALVLSDEGIVNARPQLEIHADDVKCAHGAAVGSLDEEALFYLRQRGLDPLAARALLTEAFAAEIVADVPVELREGVVGAIRRWLERA